MMILNLLVLLFNVSPLTGLPIPDQNQGPSSLSDQVDLFKFFRDFGYLKAPPSDSETLYTEESVTRALKQVQKFGGIQETGKFDNETQKLLSTPRCGNPDLIDGDFEGNDQQRRRKRYIIGSEGWKSKQLTYRLDNVSPKFPHRGIVEESLKKAFDAWSRYSGLTFEQVGDFSVPDISISFGRYNHGDRYPFDGPGYTLAHAYYPYTFGALGGDIHFDEDENWGLKPQNLDLFTVAIHEIGHSLGLSHSTDRDSVMFAYYKGESPALGYDDILAVYNLYIQNGPSTSLEETEVSTTPSSTTTSTSSTSRSTTYSPTTTESNDRAFDGSENPVNEICNGSFDSVAVIRSEIFVFKGQNVWRYQRPGDLVSGFPLPFSRMFAGIPQHIKRIDAAYEKSDGTIVFFSGDRFYHYDGVHWTKESHLSTLGLPEDYKSIDSIFLWEGKTYVFKGDRYWRLDSNERVVEDGYPKLIKESWIGGPSRVKSMVDWKGHTYAFYEDQFWRFEKETLRAESGYPLQMSSYWFPHCRN